MAAWIKDVTQLQLRWALALGPGLTFLLLAHAVGLAIASLDELQRRIQTEAIAIGFGLASVVVVSVGFLGAIGLEQPNWVIVAMVMILGWAIGKIWTLWKYR